MSINNSVVSFRYGKTIIVCGESSRNTSLQNFCHLSSQISKKLSCEKCNQTTFSISHKTKTASAVRRLACSHTHDWAVASQIMKEPARYLKTTKTLWN